MTPTFTCSKACYTKKEARTVANRRKVELRLYYCDGCSAWHLTKRIDPVFSGKTEGVVSDVPTFSDMELVLAARKEINLLGGSEVLKELARRFLRVKEIGATEI